MPGTDASPIVIVGAGIGGLTAALALLRAGFPVLVLEQAAALHEAGAGLTLAPNATRVLDALGLGDGLRRIASPTWAAAVRHWRTGAPSAVSERGAESLYGSPYQLHRADLQELLAAAVRAHDADALRLGHACVGFLDEAEHGVGVRCAGGAIVRGRALVGADGARSAVRAQLLHASPPEYTGYCAWRGLVPATALPADSFDEYPSSLYVGPDRIFARYPVRCGSLVNFVAATREPQPAPESWSARGDRAEALAAFDGFHAPVRAILAAVPEGALHKWALYAREPLLEWVEGCVGMLGDAAHPMLPFLGQGAAMAIEDAAVLARAFAAEPDAPDRALARYQAARLARATRVQRLAATRGHALLAADPEACGHELKVGEDAPDLYAYDATTVAV